LKIKYLKIFLEVYNNFFINGKTSDNKAGHYSLWISDMKSSWINELGLNFNDYTGFDQGNKEQFIKLLKDVGRKIMNKKITVTYVTNKGYLNITKIKLLV
jgi:hypothetical protein